MNLRPTIGGVLLGVALVWGYHHWVKPLPGPATS